MKYLITFALIIISGIPSISCSCVGTETIGSAYKNSDVVFTGTVVNMEVIKSTVGQDITWDLQKVTFKINEQFKYSLNSDKFIVYTGIGNGDCGYLFKQNTQYIIFGSWETVNRQKELMTDICTRTTTALDNKEVIQHLHKIKK